MSDSVSGESGMYSALRDDPVILRLISSMPQQVQESFSEEQLAHLKLAIGTRHWEKHAVDLRGTFKLWQTRYYYVLLLGRNHREVSRWQKQMSGIITTLILLVFLMFSAVMGFLILYLVKSLLGINLFKGFSLGIWDWFKALFE